MTITIPTAASQIKATAVIYAVLGFISERAIGFTVSDVKSDARVLYGMDIDSDVIIAAAEFQTRKGFLVQGDCGWLFVYPYPFAQTYVCAAA